MKLFSKTELSCLVPTRTQFGHDGKDARYARARALFEPLEEVVAGRPAPAHSA